MSTNDSGDATSGPALPVERAAAAERLLGRGRSEAIWFLKRLEEEGWRHEDLWCLRTPDGPVLAAGLVTLHPGRTASISLGVNRGAEQTRNASRLLRDVLARLSALGEVVLAQGMTPAEDAKAAEPFVHAGFVELAILDCMERPNESGRPAPSFPAGSSLRPVSDDASLRRLLRATYEDTLDCPGLADLRSDQDILDGHRRGGKADTDLWAVLQIQGIDAGAVLLNRGAAGESVELCYLGLAKWARGKGFGALMLDEALTRASRLPERFVTVAVDERNTPAARLYRSRGFRTVARRRAFARRVDSST